MAIVQNYTGWSTRVNRIILDSTTITVGENALKTDDLENGGKRSKPRTNVCADKYSVIMEFDWETKNERGLTELQEFYNWYKYVHQYGTVPFEFPSILFSPVTGIKVIDDDGKVGNVEYYKITSALECGKSGTSVQVKMTWESVYMGATTYIQDDMYESDFYIEPKNGYTDIVMTYIPDTIPTTENILIKITKDGSDTSVIDNARPSGLYYDGAGTLRVYHDSVSESGIYNTEISLSFYTNKKSYAFKKIGSFEV